MKTSFLKKTVKKLSGAACLLRQTTKGSDLLNQCSKKPGKTAWKSGTNRRRYNLRRQMDKFPPYMTTVTMKECLYERQVPSSWPAADLKQIRKNAWSTSVTSGKMLSSEAVSTIRVTVLKWHLKPEQYVPGNMMGVMRIRLIIMHQESVITVSRGIFIRNHLIRSA